MICRVLVTIVLIAALSGWLLAGGLIAWWQYWLVGIPVDVLAAWLIASPHLEEIR